MIIPTLQSTKVCVTVELQFSGFLEDHKLREATKPYELFSAPVVDHKILEAWSILDFADYIFYAVHSFDSAYESLIKFTLIGPLA